ncbi:selenocysteine Se-methyltransferase-like [Odontomachus brunneus]|uniref:selenocysteine Se-methyltransferase-like n=1 Tax=Odontomachus brunneus TaxID=486640 RepID=UPI0013F2116C|nr:selenocysteine Se-methyltransferase-like [Odontomachus brunneus]
MDDLLVLDGDFEAQLRCHLTLTGEVDKTFALQALQSNPGAIYRTHLDYLRVGAKIIRTNTYRASKSTLMAYLNIPASKGLELISLAVKLAQQAVNHYYKSVEGNHYNNTGQINIQQPLVAGSCGSYFATHFSDQSDILMKNKNLTSDYVAFFYQQRIDTLLNAGVDLLAFESIPSFIQIPPLFNLSRITLEIYVKYNRDLQLHIDFTSKLVTLNSDQGRNFIIALRKGCDSLVLELFTESRHCVQTSRYLGTVRTMDELTVIDGDFDMHVRQLLDLDLAYDPLFDLEILRSNPNMVYKTYLDYLRAGAKIIKTNTHRANTKFMKKYLHMDEIHAEFITTVTVKKAKQAIKQYYEETGGDTKAVTFHERRPLVAGCCGSYNILRVDSDGPIAYWDFVPLQVVMEEHYSHMKVLLAAGVDLLAFESIPCLMEAKAIIRALKCSGSRAWITFLCSMNGILADGTTFAEAATYCYESLPDQFIAIGADCPYPRFMKSWLKDLNKNRDSKIPILFRIEKHYLGFTQCTNACGDFLQEFVNIGVRYLGGGCLTSAEDVKQISKEIEIFRISKNKTDTSVCQDKAGPSNQ